MTEVFPTAQEARSGARNNALIHAEIRDIEEAILTALESGLYSVQVGNTTMTSSTVGSPVTITDIDTSTDVLTTGTVHNLVSGDVVQVSATTTMPSPLSATAYYYSNVLTISAFKLATTESDATAGTNLIDIVTEGAGTITVTKLSLGQLYYATYKKYIKNRVFDDQMDQVITYFEKLGYSITRKTNGSTNSTFLWEVLW